MQEKNIPIRADETTPTSPWPISVVNTNIKKYITKLPSFWIEGEIVEYNHRPGTNIAFIVVRDLKEKVSIQAYAYSSVIDKTPAQLGSSVKIIARVTPDFWQSKGTITLRLEEIRVDGIGDVLMQIEMLRKKFVAQGLFDASRKKPLPFIPRKVGLICGRKAKAKYDILNNSRLRWHINFEIREVAVQGPECLPSVLSALHELENTPEVDVIIIARGGGSVEDLLPFSEEAMVLAIAQCPIPVVSAIGHETDFPLIDFVADYRASTPTDAAMKISPSYIEEENLLANALHTVRKITSTRLDNEIKSFKQFIDRPILKNPLTIVETHKTQIEHLSLQLRSVTQTILQRHVQELSALSTKVTALSPIATLERGYSIATTERGKVVVRVEDLTQGENLQLHLSDGSATTTVISKEKR